MNTTRQTRTKKTFLKKISYVILPLLIIASIGLSQIQTAQSQTPPLITALQFDFYVNNGTDSVATFLGDYEPYKSWPPYQNPNGNPQCSMASGNCVPESRNASGYYTNWNLTQFNINVTKSSQLDLQNRFVYITGKLQRIQGSPSPTTLAPPTQYQCNLQPVSGGTPCADSNTWLLTELDINNFSNNVASKTVQAQQDNLKPASMYPNLTQVDKYLWSNVMVYILYSNSGDSCKIASCQTEPNGIYSYQGINGTAGPVFRTYYWPIVSVGSGPANGACTDFTVNNPAPTWSWNYENALDVPTPPTKYRVALMTQANKWTYTGGSWQIGGLVTYNYTGDTPSSNPDGSPGIAVFDVTSPSFTLPATVPYNGSNLPLAKNGEFLPGYDQSNPVEGKIALKSTGNYYIEVEENWRPSGSGAPSTHPARKAMSNAGNIGPTWKIGFASVKVAATGGCAGRPLGLVTYNNNPTYQDPVLTDQNDPRYLNPTAPPYPEKNNEPAVIAYDGSWHDLNYQTTNTDDKKCSFNGQNSWTATKLVSFTKPVFKFIYSMRSSDKQFGFSANGSAITGYEAQLQKYVSGAWVNEGAVATMPYDNSASKITKNCWFPTSALDRTQNYRVKVQATTGTLKSDIFIRELPSDTRPSYLQYQSTSPVVFQYSNYNTDPVEVPADSAPAVQVATASNQTEYGIIKPSSCGGNTASLTQPVWSWQSPPRLPTYPNYEYGFKANGANTISRYVVALEKSADSGNTWSTDFSDNNYTGTCFRPASPLITTNNLYRLKVVAYDSQPSGGNPSDTVVRTLFGALLPPYVTLVYPASYCSAFTADQLWGINTQVTVVWQWGYTQPSEPAQYQQFIITLQKENKAPIYAYTFNPNAQNSFSDKNDTFQIDYATGVVKVTSKLNNNNYGILKYLLNAVPGAVGNNSNYNGRYILKVKTQLVNDPGQVSAERSSYAKVDLAPPNFPLGTKIENVISPTQEVGWDDGTEVWQGGVSVSVGGYNMPTNISGQSGYNNPYTFNLATKVQATPYLKWPLDFSSAPVFSWLVNGPHTISSVIADSACGTMNVWPFSPFTIQNTTNKSWTLTRAGTATADASPPIVRPMKSSEYTNFYNYRRNQCVVNPSSHGWNTAKCDTDKSYFEGRAAPCDPTRPTDLAAGPDTQGLNAGAFVWTRGNNSSTLIPRVQPQGKNYNLGCEAIQGAGTYQKDLVKTADNAAALAFVIEDQGDLTCSTGGTSQCPTAATNFTCTAKQAAATPVPCYCRSINTAMVDACAGDYTMNTPTGINPSTTSIEMALNGAFGSQPDTLYRPINSDYTRKLSDLMGQSFPLSVRCSVSTLAGQGATAGYNKCEVMLRLPDFIWFDGIYTGNTWPYYEPSLDPNNEWRAECLALSGQSGQTCTPGTGNAYTGLHPERPDVTGPLGAGQYIYSTFKTASSIVDTPKYSSPSTSPYRYQTYYQDNSSLYPTESYHLRVNTTDANSNTQNQIIKFRVNQNPPETP